MVLNILYNNMQIQNDSYPNRRKSIEFWETFDSNKAVFDMPCSYHSVFDESFAEKILSMEITFNSDVNEGPYVTKFLAECVSSINDEDFSVENGREQYDETPTTPHQEDRRDVYREITPEQVPSSVVPAVDLQELAELDMSCQRAMKKLECSMRRSDATRLIVKRQRLNSSHKSENEQHRRFFTCSHAREIAETRQELYDAIDRDAYASKVYVL